MPLCVYLSRQLLLIGISLKQEKQESIQESKIDREKNTIEAMLENVEAKEKDLQKEIIKNKMKQNEQKPESNQKPW